ncbi:hypothetical protein [Flavobacterium myungsuense]|uniref:Uncharacterized protein n=1 Tax=Flavobacterium myungsuense TaxID=651823 RepID=A0ABW3IYM1_9FLAO
MNASLIAFPKYYLAKHKEVNDLKVGLGFVIIPLLKKIIKTYKSDG